MFSLRYYKTVQSLYIKLTPGLNNHIGNLDNFRKAVESPRSWNLMGYFCPKNTFLQLKDDIHRIYPALLSTTCVKIHQRTYVIFEPPAQPLYIFLAQKLHTFCKNSLSKWKFNTCHCLQYKVHPIPHVIFGSKSQFFFKLCITLQCHETNSAVLFHLNLYVLWTKGSDQSENFQTFNCLHEN